MAKMIINLKVRPESPEIDLGILEKKVKEKLTEQGSEGDITTKTEDLAFGMKELIFRFQIDEDKELEPVEKSVEGLDEVSSVQVAGMSRALG